MIEILAYTLAAIILYAVSDWILQRMELSAGRRFEYRSLIFFFILSTLAISCFSLIQYIISNQ